MYVVVHILEETNLYVQILQEKYTHDRAMILSLYPLRARLYTHKCTYIYIHICVCLHTYINTYTCPCTCTYIIVCIYM